MTVHGGKFYQGIWWPTNIKDTAPDHALRHVRDADPAIALARKSIAIQAGGNIGLWPLRMAESFEHVHTFEPDVESMRFLLANTGARRNITAHSIALGAVPDRCSIKHKSLGSHHVVDGSTVKMETLDRLFHSSDIGLIQLDVEGYEHLVLLGAVGILRRCKPVVQLELRGLSEKYGGTDARTRGFMLAMGYGHSQEVGADVIFWQGA